MVPVNFAVVRFSIEIMYCLSTAVMICGIIACSNPCTLWNTMRFLSYTLLSFYEATRVVLLGISIITGCIGRMYGTGYSVAYFVLFIKIPIFPLMPPPRLEWTDRALLFSSSFIWCRGL